MIAFSFHLVVVFTTSIDGTVMEKREALMCTRITLKTVKNAIKFGSVTGWMNHECKQDSRKV